jgi:hypothetical protein
MTKKLSLRRLFLIYVYRAPHHSLPTLLKSVNFHPQNILKSVNFACINILKSVVLQKIKT